MEIVPGVTWYQGYLDRAAQDDLVACIRTVVAAAPFYTPSMPRTGKPLSVHMTNCGPLGWMTDKTGYRYQAMHPVTGQSWPPIPDRMLAIWRDLADVAAPPEACLINLYRDKAKLGLHVDQDEQEVRAPVVSVSLGDTAVFRVGGLKRADPTRTVKLSSGDVVVLAGPGRLVHHGVDRILGGTSTLLDNGGRLNLTLRRVTPIDIP